MTGISTDLIHSSESNYIDVTPPINITTTYKYSDDPEKLVKAVDRTGPDYFHNDNWTYSRLTHQNSELIENLLESLLEGKVVVYNSGLAAFNAALTHINPKTVIIGQAYHGCHAILEIWKRNFDLKVLDINVLDNFEKLQPGDLVHLETPVNPLGTSFDIEFYAKKAHEKGALLMVDATFAPPPLQRPFNHGADIIMHSATKYFGGHSDLLAGLLVTKDEEVRQKLFYDRLLLGTNIGNLESSLLVRSLKTYELRILRQSDNCTKLVAYLNSNKEKFPNLKEVFHSSLQSDEHIRTQLSGHSPTFSITLQSEDLAKRFPSKLKYFYHATSLGGVESLIEWRAISDPTVDTALLRVSVGVENVEDLIDDFTQALTSS